MEQFPSSAILRQELSPITVHYVDLFEVFFEIKDGYILILRHIKNLVKEAVLNVKILLKDNW